VRRAAPTAVDYDPFAGGALERGWCRPPRPQREVWLADRLGDDASLAYNEAVRCGCAAARSCARCAAALRALVARHESLRATFGPTAKPAA
jgi:hypothetical protein